MRRREFLIGAGAALPAVRAAGQEGTLLLLSDDDARAIPSKIGKPETAQLRGLADRALTSGPWSVTFHRPTGSAINAQDYFSEGPYWWPDPKNPTGPYIRRDGERNPERFDANHHDLGAMAAAVLTLGMGAYFLDAARYAPHAAKILEVWFTDPKTRMNPNLQHGQAIRGRTTGRGTGIIDTVSLIYAAQGIALLKRTGRLDAELDTQVRRWYAEYLAWMTTSAIGLSEKRAANNHGTWWAAQVAAYAALVGDGSLAGMVWGRAREVLIPGEIEPDGSCPLELARTNSLSYSAFNLDAFAVLCRLAQESGVDLWRFRTAKGIGVARAFTYLTPYVLNPGAWKRQQIHPFTAGNIVFPGLAAVGLRSAELLEAYRRLPRVNSAWILLVDWIVRADAGYKNRSLTPA
ncbi:MAG: alginate lyase family protein [Bryobacteraceae bacterium]